MAEVIDAGAVEPTGAGVGDERLGVEGVGSELGRLACSEVEPGEIFVERVPRTRSVGE